MAIAFEKASELQKTRAVEIGSVRIENIDVRRD